MILAALGFPVNAQKFRKVSVFERKIAEIVPVDLWTHENRSPDYQSKKFLAQNAEKKLRN